jgi:subtilisin-like proprotein convertase family protein
MRKRAAWLGLAAWLVAPNASADRLATARSQPVEELRHVSELRIDAGVARHRVERGFRNRGEQADEVSLDLSLPVGAAANGLAIRVGNEWLDGELMRRERAAELYRELTGFGPHQPKDPALLSWTWASELELRVFPVPAGGESHVAYTLVAPTTYRDGRYFVTYPRVPSEGGLSTSQLRLIDAVAPRIDGRPVDSSALLSLELEKGDKPAWFGAHEPVSGASYVKSDVAIAERGKVTKAKVAVDIQHTYQGDLTLELVAPDGRWHPVVSSRGGGSNDIRETFTVDLGTNTLSEGTWRLVVSDHARLDTGTLKKWSLELAVDGRTVVASAGDTPKFVPDAVSEGDDGMATISMAAPPIHTVAARLGSVPAAPDKAFFRLEIDTAAQLRPTPKALNAVFVIDASRSLRDDVAIQLELVRAFLSHLPDATFEIVLVRRKATRLVGRFAAASELTQVIADAEQRDAFALGNGSSLEAGLAEAGAALRDRRGPRTVVVMTDDLMRPGWRNQHALSALPAGATVHVVLPSAGSRVAHDRRDDEHRRTPIATRGGGVLLHVSDIDGPSKQLDDIALGLVRPIRIDGFRVEGVTLPDGHTMPDRLAEGDGLREMAQLVKAPTRVRLRGKIWARPFDHEVVATLPFSRATAAFVFSHDLHTGLSDGEMFRLAMTAGAVTPVTSYLAIEPGVRPSTIGLEGRGQGFGSGHGRLGRSHRAGVPHVRGGPPPFDAKAAMGTAVSRCVAKHQPADGWAVELKLDTTFEEIVHIEPGVGAMHGCLVEGAWQLELPVDNFEARRDTLSIALP